MPAAAVGYFSALAGKAKSFVGAVSRAAAAQWAGPPKPAKYAVHPDTPVERQYDKHDKQKIKGKLKDDSKKAYFFRQRRQLWRAKIHAHSNQARSVKNTSKDLHT
jgi:hypothetical protein